MEGVQFILSNPVYEGITNPVLYTFVCCVCIIMIIWGSVLIHKAISKKDYVVAVASLVMVLLLGALIVTQNGTNPEKSFSHNEYQVTIAEDVKLKEFMENYEIVDVKGEIYTIVIKSELESPKEIA